MELEEEHSKRSQKKIRKQKKPKGKPVESTSKVFVLASYPSKKEQEVYLRLNFLYQLAKSTNQLHAGLSMHYLAQFIEVAEKRVIRMYRATNSETSRSRDRSANGVRPSSASARSFAGAIRRWCCLTCAPTATAPRNRRCCSHSQPQRSLRNDLL